VTNAFRKRRSIGDEIQRPTRPADDPAWRQFSMNRYKFRNTAFVVPTIRESPKLCETTMTDKFRRLRSNRRILARKSRGRLSAQEIFSDRAANLRVYLLLRVANRARGNDTLARPPRPSQRYTPEILWEPEQEPRRAVIFEVARSGFESGRPCRETPSGTSSSWSLVRSLSGRRASSVATARVRSTRALLPRLERRLRRIRSAMNRPT
jgi:hypothetical protein